KLAGILYLAKQPQPDIPKAVGIYRELLRLLPHHTMAMTNVAVLLVEENTPTYNPSEAVTYAQKVYDQALRQGAQNELPLIMDTLAWGLIKSGRTDEGIS